MTSNINLHHIHQFLFFRPSRISSTGASSVVTKSSQPLFQFSETNFRSTSVTSSKRRGIGSIHSIVAPFVHTLSDLNSRLHVLFTYLTRLPRDPQVTRAASQSPAALEIVAFWESFAAGLAIHHSWVCDLLKLVYQHSAQYRPFKKLMLVHHAILKSVVGLRFANHQHLEFAQPNHLQSLTLIPIYSQDTEKI